MDLQIKKEQINHWYHEFSHDLFNYICFLIRDHDHAKDILQDTFLRAFNHIDSFRGDNVRGWLFRIARNTAIDEMRKKKPITYFLETLPIMQTTEYTPEQIAVLNESERELYVALSKLKLSYRDVIILRKIKEFSIKETASILGWSENKVKVNLFRGMKALRKELEKENFSHETVR
ncbi:RNA polymerase sigma factor [Ornithinibacillus halotolerans]|uniref:ECF RNA polymerase sigma factor SigW n=1 Tax=Ornithinibacillus halotolerans TaxID=1274357 RepID=A0A916WDJ0_9BACI|nr:sigma-70 family RNA polymerase sigma factor [Ornithinibacillus halotolerans]GGA88990.1 ECF RNA polymerase sigma factor SigW [Ornithinibacillus halotolerans]